jgi:Replication-relaxation
MGSHPPRPPASDAPSANGCTPQACSPDSSGASAARAGLGRIRLHPRHRRATAHSNSPHWTSTASSHPLTAVPQPHLAVTEIYVQLIELTRQGPLQLACFHTEPDCWRTFLGPYGQLVVVKPDAYIALRADSYEDRYFIEVDLATESTTTVTRKTETYRRYWASGTEQAAHGVFPLVLFLVPDQPRRTQLENVIAGQPSDSQRIYHVATYDQAIEVFRAGAVP